MCTSKPFSIPYGTSVLKFLILTCAFYTIYIKIQDFEFPLPPMPSTAFFILVSLSFINWCLEILKWKSLASTIVNISFKTSICQSLAAHTAAIITPNKIGEYGAKAVFYKKPMRKQVLVLTFLGNAHQMLITSIFGLFGVLLYNQKLFDQNTIAALLLLLLITGAISFYLHKTRNIFSYFQNISIHTQIRIFILSLLRYLFFSFQYLFILNTLGIQNSYIELLPLIWLIYFISSCIPSFALLDFAIKGSVALFVFSHLQIPESIILTTAFLMYLFNFALPALIGGFYISTFNSSKQLDYDITD